ncbi:MAG: AAA family ATPase [Myxococcaceae bacterium]|nr:MAG: AAA family ATPase [Myxococcaceae bacterium]
MSDIEKDLVHIARLALEGRRPDLVAVVRRSLRSLAGRRPDLKEQINAVLTLASASPPTREASRLPIPADNDSRAELIRRDDQPGVAIEPTWPAAVEKALGEFLLERDREAELRAAGLSPVRSLLFIGPPGVGKTMAGHWVAQRLGRSLLTLDLAAVMSSYLGRTGLNLKVVLDYARHQHAVLLLDEFDAIAKRRNDDAEVGELKRLVTVLLQAIDQWPSDGVLLAATNHPELLDAAVWRRFDRVIEFPCPTVPEIRSSVERLLGASAAEDLGEILDTLAALLGGQSFADVARQVNAARRASVLRGIPLSEALTELTSELVRAAPLERKLQFARELERQKRSQRTISQITGLSRDTIRKHLGKGAPTGGRK